MGVSIASSMAMETDIVYLDFVFFYFGIDGKMVLIYCLLVLLVLVMDVVLKVVYDQMDRRITH